MAFISCGNWSVCGNIKIGEAIWTLRPCLTCDYDVACTDLFVTISTGHPVTECD